jgi:hypothetical protein
MLEKFKDVVYRTTGPHDFVWCEYLGRLNALRAQ